MSKTRDFRSPDNKTIQNIVGNYRQKEKALVNQLYFKASHGTTIGGFRESIWREMFAQMIPKKFVIEQSVFIMDSKGRVSNEVDLAIIDETYTPYIFRYGRLKFLPIEAVAVAIECKSTLPGEKKLDQLKNWAESIAVLETSCESYTRIIQKIVIGETSKSPTQTATRPLRILCCLDQKKIDRRLNSGSALFDIIIRAETKGTERLTIEPDDSNENLRDWYLTLNHAVQMMDNETSTGSAELAKVNLDNYQIGSRTDPVALLTLNLQLNQLLMLINNPLPFPHKAYAKMFNEYGTGGQC